MQPGYGTPHDTQAGYQSTTTAPAGTEPGAPYAYTQPTGYGGYENQPSSEPPANTRMILIVGALILAVCCAFACGLVFGFEIIPDILGLGGAGPAPRPTGFPTPNSLLPVVRYLMA